MQPRALDGEVDPEPRGLGRERGAQPLVVGAEHDELVALHGVGREPDDPLAGPSGRVDRGEDAGDRLGGDRRGREGHEEPAAVRADGLLGRLDDADGQPVVTAEVRAQDGTADVGGRDRRGAVELHAQDEVAPDGDLADVGDRRVDAAERAEQGRGDPGAVLARQGHKEAVPSVGVLDVGRHARDGTPVRPTDRCRWRLRASGRLSRRHGRVSRSHRD